MNKSKITEILEKHAKWLNGEADGERANLCGADLHGASLHGAELCGADLSLANLRGADLFGADLYGANLCGADLHGANLHVAKIEESVKTKLFPLACPEYGAFIAWKKLADGRIAKLLIPEDALRSSAYGRKCRASKAVVLSIVDTSGTEVDEGHSQYDTEFIYRVGETVEVAVFDRDRWNECSTGIHFFITRQEAVDC